MGASEAWWWLGRDEKGPRGGEHGTKRRRECAGGDEPGRRERKRTKSQFREADGQGES